MYDAIIVGARCGGSPLAMLLAKAGHRVLAVDRATFPSDTLSTHAISGDAPMRLAAWGALERIGPLDGTSVTISPIAHVGGQHFPIPGQAIYTRRTVLDKVLVDLAREAGAEVREGFSVTGLVRDPEGRVTGIEGHGKDGVVVREEAKVVVGADGRNSLVAKEVDAPGYNELEPLTCGYYSYFEGVPDAEPAIHFGPDFACFVFPTSHGQACLVTEHPMSHFESLRSDIDRGVRESFEAVGMGEFYAKARRIEEWKGAARMSNYYRKPFGPGWALVGDAGYLKDPVLGQGINDAFRDADLLAGALDRTFRGEAEYDAALGAYQQQRDAATAGIYAFNYEFAKLQVTPQHVQMLIAAAEAQIAMAAAAAGGH